MNASQSQPNRMELTDDEANNISRARHLLRLVGDLADVPLNAPGHWRELDRESLSVYARVVEALLPERF